MLTARSFLPFSASARQGPIADIERRYRRYVAPVLVLGVMASLLEGLGIGILVPLISAILAPESAGLAPRFLRPLVTQLNRFDPHQPMVVLVVVTIGIVGTKALVMALNGLLMAWVEGRAGRAIRDAMARHLLHLDYGYFLRNDTASLVTLIDTESWHVTETIRLTFNVVVGGAAVAIFVILLGLTDWRLTAVVIFGIVAARLCQIALARQLDRLGRSVTATNRQLGELMVQLVRAVRLIRLFGQEPREARRFEAASEAVQAAMFGTDRWSALSQPLIETTLSLLIVMIVVTARSLALSLPTTAAFLVLLYRVQSPLMLANYAVLRLASLRGSVAAVDALFDEPIVDRKPAHAQPFDWTQPLCFDRVAFSYPGDRTNGALDEISFSLPPGSITALVGRSGSGKSTIVNLIARLVSPTAGSIQLGERDIEESDAQDWRRHIAVAGQELDLITATVAENIAYGCGEVGPAAIERAARAADAHDFIQALPAGYDTPLGALGFGLSGGQRQRIGLARALLREPELLILDEATSAVDGISEDLILSMLRQHRRFDRALVISHRLETLSLCDFGIVIDAGRVVEAGAFADLDWTIQGARLSSRVRALP